MLASQFPDWKNIGWHIGKKLRDILHQSPGDSGPSKAERKAQRLRDVLKGFAYFDDFDELCSWNASEVDPLQQANTPLLERAAPSVHDRSGPTSKVLLCHDYKGGYHDYEAIRPHKVDNKLYSCRYLQYVDTFVYFSHKLVCVPPPTWTNTLHRNGVKVLGTFILEPQSPEIERLLVKVDGRFRIAEQLASMAETFGFDGWLVNMEKAFSKNVTKDLIAFIQCLKQAMGSRRQVVWYDALNVDNEVQYQNGLTTKNIEFAQVADALFTNYKWTESKLRNSKELTLKHYINKPNVYFGVDVWAQNTNMEGPPRVTFPSDGGGGTNTGLAITRLAQDNFSTAIFAPGWTYEHFSANCSLRDGQSISEAVDRSMWEGAALPDDLGCDCQKAKPHHTSFYRSNPITQHACEFPAGSSEFFDTMFRGAFEDNSGTDVEDRHMTSVLGLQDISPKLHPVFCPLWKESTRGLLERVMYGNLSEGEDPYLTINTKLVGVAPTTPSEISRNHNDTRTQSWPTYRLCLYKIKMPADGTRRILIDYIRERASRTAKVGLYAAFGSGPAKELEYQDYELSYKSSERYVASFDMLHEDAENSAMEVGVYCKGIFERSEALPLLRIRRISIKPIPAVVSDSAFTITNIRVVQRGESPNVHKRLIWEWEGPPDAWPTGLPWSKRTGPFSHFVISADCRKLGYAHCLEFPILEEDFEIDQATSGNNVEIGVDGVLFGGGVVNAPRIIVPT